MKIDKILTFEQYYRDRRFAHKIPDFNRGKTVCEYGDNIYEPLPEGGFDQVCPSQHSKKDMKRDLSGKNVLISWNFHYFGPIGPELPDDLSELKVGIGFKCNFPAEVISTFEQFIAEHPKGFIAPPTMGRLKDKSLRP